MKTFKEFFTESSTHKMTDKRNKEFYLKWVGPTRGNESYNLTPDEDCWVDEQRRLHRGDGPAFRLFTQLDRKDIIYQKYYKHGKLHRLDGPAIEVLIPDKTLQEPAYCINGVYYKKDDFDAIISNIEPQNREEVIDIGSLF